MPRRHRLRRFAGEPVRWEIPVFPAVIVCFMSMSIFTFTIRVSPVESQITVPLPHEVVVEDLPFRRDIPPVYVHVTADAGPDGTIGNITIHVQGVFDVPEPPADVRVGADLRRCRAELKARRAAYRDRRCVLILELGDGVRYAGFLQLLDAASSLGFDDILMFPADPRKR